MRKILALYATLLAGTHMAQSVQPSTAPVDDPKPTIIPIQWGGPGYGGPPPGYDGPPPWVEGGPGWYGRRGMGGQYWGRDMDPGTQYMQRRWRWESDQYGRYRNPPWAGRPW